MKRYQIVEDGVVVGDFPDELDRDEAFKDNFVNTERNGYKKEIGD